MTKRINRVIGIDPGTRVLAYAVYDMNLRKIIDYGSRKFSSPKARIELMPYVCGLLDQHVGCDVAVGVESPWMGRNVRTTGVLSELLGAIVEAARSRKIPIEKIPPRKWQSRLHMRFGARRDEIKRMSMLVAKSILGKEANQDECDAVHIAMTMAADISSGKVSLEASSLN